ncbi:MAG: RagB/SusD family nutrient uptake outer membrane protein [Bacteroidales bacterium]|nr:RagB/SusD family nutrient uptake outer membrane protein [Bacteroidales bacterium]MBN2820387.1 RagB/SusD family nutrient uptake outer membrane protein [Bacteroidales bacterium]
MKSIYIKTIIGTVILSLFLSACDDFLVEEPRSIYTPEYFKTELGVQGGLSSMYQHLRKIYGPRFYYSSTQTGTDEVTYGESANNGFFVHDFSGMAEITAENNGVGGLWNAAFPNINTASGIIENAAEVGISEDLIAEAHFFRAFDYFLLVQTFGGVPLDLGAGELKFNSSTNRTSVRNTVPEVYTKCIFPDLLIAVDDLPEEGRVIGGATKTLARLYLAKAYLTYAWWLENPNDIPTYPETSRTDPDGHDAQWYFQQAYDIAIEGIENPGPFGLQPTYYDVHIATNDRNNEMLLYADHTETSEIYNGSSLTYSGGEGTDNVCYWMMNWNYPTIRSNGVSSVVRWAGQHGGRPWTRMCPTIGAITNTFADKTNDSRYDGSFTTVWRGNWPLAGTPDETVTNANGIEVAPGEPILTILDEEPTTAIDFPAGDGPSAVGAGTLPGRSDYVIGPRNIGRKIYPTLWKLGVYRTDNEGGIGQPNAASTRPYNIAKFSELYFVAAEAAVKGATGTQSARELINVIRARAGVWRFDNNGNTIKEEDNSAAMIAATPETIDIYYILAERSREYFGEGYRWYDLVRTQTWTELAATYEICGANFSDHEPEKITRTIEPYHYLRPIPIDQLNGMEMTEEDKDAYQNPGYVF